MRFSEMNSNVAFPIFAFWIRAKQMYKAIVIHFTASGTFEGSDITKWPDHFQGC